jgi:FkbM family methyltransferase
VKPKAWSRLTGNRGQARGYTNHSLTFPTLPTSPNTFRECLVRAYSRVAPFEKGTFRLARFARSSRQPEHWHGWLETPDNLKLKLDLSTYPDVSMAYGLYELDSIRTIRALLKAGDHFIDCGANIGYVTLLASKIVGPAGRVDAVEPEPHNRGRLLEHLVANGVTNTTVHDLALGDAAGTAEIFFPPPRSNNHGTSSLYAPTPDATASDVRVAPLDDVVRGSPAVIKIDVEGAEPLAIDGMSNLLSSATPPAIVIEHNPVTAKRAGFAPEEWLRRLLAIQPRYQAWEIAWRLKRLRAPLAQLASADQINVLLRVMP